MTDYDVIAAFRVALNESTDPDPANVALAVAAAVPARQRAEALAQALVRLAPTVAGQQRRTAMPVAPGRDRWSTAAAIYQHHLLAQRLRIGDEWKLMGDCTADDLRAAASQRREHAAAVIVHADQLDRIAALLDERGALTVSDLGRTDLDQLEPAA
jgi:hypothetical protein